MHGRWPRAIAFDCYGTLLRINDQRRPYQRLSEFAGGRLNPSPLTSALSLSDVVARNVPPVMLEPAALEALESDLMAEDSVR